MYQSGLGMPDRDYYLKADPKLDQTRTAYKAYLAKMLTLAGESNAEARASAVRSEEHTSELQSLMRISYAVFCLKKKKERKNNHSLRITPTLTKDTHDTDRNH